MGTHYKGPVGVRRALDTYIKLLRANDSIASVLRAALRKDGLTIGQLGVLEALFHLGRLSPSALADKLLTSPSNLTTLIDNLESDGMVRRDRSGGDRRSIEISLTKAGRARIQAVFPRHVQRISELMSALAAEEQEVLGRLCRKLGRAAAAREP